MFSFLFNVESGSRGLQKRAHDMVLYSSGLFSVTVVLVLTGYCYCEFRLRRPSNNPPGPWSQ